MPRARPADQAPTPSTLVGKPYSMIEDLCTPFSIRAYWTRYVYVPPAVVAAAREREGAQAAQAVLGGRIGHP